MTNQTHTLTTLIEDPEWVRGHEDGLKTGKDDRIVYGPRMHGYFLTQLAVDEDFPDYSRGYIAGYRRAGMT